jgi:hypothetical protein
LPGLASSVRGLALHQHPGGVGDDDLAGGGRGGDPGGPVHVDAAVVVPAKGALAGVQAHPDPHREPGRPAVAGQAALGVHRGPDRPHRAGEGGEERVALGADLDPAVPDRPAQDGRVLVAHRPVAVAQVLEQPGRTLDVGEQEGHRSGGRAERPAGPDPLGGGHGHGDDPAEQGGRDHPGVAGQVQLAVVGAPHGQLRYGPG